MGFRLSNSNLDEPYINAKSTDKTKYDL